MVVSCIFWNRREFEEGDDIVNRLSGLISSPPDRESLVYEIWLGSTQLAEISRESDGKFRIEVYSHPDSDKWSLELEDFLSVVHTGKAELLDLQRRSAFDE